MKKAFNITGKILFFPFKIVFKSGKYIIKGIFKMLEILEELFNG